MSEQTDLLLLLKGKNELMHYLSDREAVLTQREAKLSELAIQCAEQFRKNKILSSYSENFFTEYRRICEVAFQALEHAIEAGDDSVAALAMAIIDNQTKYLLHTPNEL